MTSEERALELIGRMFPENITFSRASFKVLADGLASERAEGYAAGIEDAANVAARYYGYPRCPEAPREPALQDIRALRPEPTEEPTA